MKEKLVEFLLANSVNQEVTDIDDDESLLEAGVVDSAMTVQLVLFVQRECRVIVDDDDLTPENFDSINGICAYVNRKGNTVP